MIAYPYNKQNISSNNTTKEIEKLLPPKFQKVLLRMIFDTKKEDLRHKAHFIVGCHVIDLFYLESYSSIVQSMSLQILLTMAENERL